MSKVFAFHGGVHPPENKKQSTRAPIGRAPLPPRLILPMQQHIGAPADPLVKVGERVLKGQLIAEPIGRVSAAIHAPTSGIVSDIAAYPIPHASGLSGECIVIEPDGQEQWIEHQGVEDFTALPPVELIEHIRRSGIAGLGGAGFPTDVKLHLGDDHIVNTLIINAAECEPYITADDMLMRERAHEVIGGIRVIAHLIRPSHILIGIEDNKPNAIHALEAALKGCELNIDIVVVPTKYPSGGERQLIKLLTDIEVPSGRIPADVGILCQNVGTTAAIYRAVHFGEPLISRVVTITGDAVRHPQNLETLIGTPFRTLLDACDLRPEALSKLVMGGPMMGVVVQDDQIPVIKTTNCLIAGSAAEMPEAPPAQPCIRCGMCEQACPADLLPQQLFWFAQGREFDKARNHNLFDCIECGACAYVCPSNIPLVQYYRFAKSEIRTEEAEQRKANHARERFEARQARLEREAAEKEAKRKARAEEAARAQREREAAASRPTTPAATASVETGATTAASTPAPVAVDSKALKTAAAVARTKLKKARDALKNAEDKGLDGVDTLRATVSDLEQKAEQAQQAFEAAEQAGSAAGPATTTDAGAELKQLKVAAAVARTKLKKAQDALKNAEEKGLEGADTLHATVTELEQKAEQAQQAFAAAEQAGTAPVTSAPAPAQTPAPADVPAEDLKALKQQVSIMRTKLKKAEANLTDCTDTAQQATLEQEIAELRQRHADAAAAFERAEQVQLAAAAAQGVDLKQLKIDAALARASVTKAERALAKAASDDERQALEQTLVDARQNAEQLSATLSRYE